MDIRMEYRYYVVQFSDLPYCDIDQYVCIPDSWIQLREIADQVVVAKFPVENLSITKKRVKDGEVFSDLWSIYVAEVKFGTDSYEDAEKYIETLKEKLINEQNCSGLVNNDDRLSKISKSLRRSKRNQSYLSVHKPQVSEDLSDYSIESVSEQLAVINTDVETSKKQTNGVETINSANEVIKQTNVSSESLNGEQLFSNTEHYLYEITRQENNDENLNNGDSIENDNGPQGRAGNESPVNHDGPQLTNESLDATIISEPFSDTCNPGQVKNASDFHFAEGFLLFLDHARDSLIQCCKVLEKSMDNTNNQYYCGSYNPFNPTIKDTVAPVVEEKEREEKEIEKKRQVAKIDPFNPTIKDTVAPVVEEKECEEKEIEKKRQVAKRTQAEIGIIKRREAERNEQEIDEDDDDNDDDGDYVKRKRFQSRTLTLPPEYDKNDSKWTLRCHESAPGLVELIEHTGVYINAVKLVNCKRLARNSKTLARLLLVEIFTESALCTCSLTGARAKAFDIDGTHVRPGLDENARTVLLTYVDQYAQASKWPKTDNQSILNSIRNKMQEIRSKFNK